MKPVSLLSAWVTPPVVEWGLYRDRRIDRTSSPGRVVARPAGLDPRPTPARGTVPGRIGSPVAARQIGRFFGLHHYCTGGLS